MPNISARIKRYIQEDKQTIGVWYDKMDVAKAYTLELPWKDNQRNVSCIPDGHYLVVKHMSPKFGQCFWLQNTFPRTQILVHAGNYNKDTQGCILVGKELVDMNGDGYRDLKESRNTLNKLLRTYSRKFEIEITTENHYGTIVGLPRIV